MENEALGLAQLVIKVRDGIKQQFSDTQWVVAEISDLNINRTGHCYLELIEKDTISDKIIAKTRATIWAFAFRMIKPYFETTTKETFRPGIKVLLKVSVEFHELYGFSLNVQDIDPQYTLGDLARKRAEIIDRLSKEGVIDLNKALEFPIVPQRIAIISSETAAGYGDFMNQLNNNAWGFKYSTQLFPAVMQGEKTVESVSTALYAIFDCVDEFDVVVIIRGGGAKSELSSFDDYDLAFAISQFPLPVLTGIGHERDDTIIDIVAYLKLKTPTAVAEFIIEKTRQFNDQLDQIKHGLFAIVIDQLDEKEGELSYFWEQISNELRNRMEKQIAFLSKANQRVVGISKKYLLSKTNRNSKLSEKLERVVQNKINNKELHLNRLKSSIRPNLNLHFQKQSSKLEFIDSKIKLLDPQNILNRGYAIVTKDKQLIKQSDALSIGDQINVRLAKGNVMADVKESKA